MHICVVFYIKYFPHDFRISGCVSYGGFAHALFNFGIYALGSFLSTLYIHTMSAFVDNILHCFIFNSSLAKGGEGLRVVGFWLAPRKGGGGGLVRLTLSACQAKTHGQKAPRFETKKNRAQPPLIRDNTFA